MGSCVWHLLFGLSVEDPCDENLTMGKQFWVKQRNGTKAEQETTKEETTKESTKKIPRLYDWDECSFKDDGKENGELPPENERSGNKTPRPTTTQSFTFIINEEEKCKDKTPFLVLLISTTAAELQHRNAIRKSWGNETAVPGADIVRLFMLGIETKGANEGVLLRESEQYRDIIQQDFLDTYNNLTLKTMMGMRWVASYCSGTRFAMKTDSDVFVNTMYLIEKLLRPLPPPTQNYFTGHLMKGHSPIRNKGSKWYISEEEFPARDRMRGNGLKLQQGRFRLTIRKNFFIKRAVKLLNRLSREVMESLLLDVSQEMTGHGTHCCGLVDMEVLGKSLD
ncbi:hypothetical protein DUI87_14636 [Hirundo rustica rustica]|uniref:Hexosyltransferase n=1 Tax=Hirundo rustica rustica TaxID=333673 RepID=A0A3M0K5C7_HIRRU|nr:hypothetical protein DUI87_14636 [Hirundo rustica rustica]